MKGLLLLISCLVLSGTLLSRGLQASMTQATATATVAVH